MTWLQKIRANMVVASAISSLELGDEERARQLVKSIRSRAPCSERHLEVLRRLDGKYIVDATVYTLLVHGRPRTGPGRRVPSGARSFHRRYDVVARDPEAALALAAVVEPERTWARLELVGVEDVKRSAKTMLSGVYRMSAAKEHELA